MNYVYKLPHQKVNPAMSNADKTKLTLKYENLLTQSKALCKKYTGPHSVLQIFLEKIIACISQISF